MNPLRRLFGLWGRHRGVELSVEDELFAERLTEMLRDYVEAEIPDSAVPRFRVPVSAQSDPAGRSAPSRRLRRSSRSSESRPSSAATTSSPSSPSGKTPRFSHRGARAARLRLEVPREDPH
jgi:hypothetical protein